MPLDFFQEFFAKRILDISAGYNIIDTLAYALIALLIAFFIIFPLLGRLKVKFNFGFALALLPFILLGSSIRVIIDLYERGALSESARLFLEGIGVFPRVANPLSISFYTVTPGIYILIAAFTIVALIVSLAIARKLNFKFNFDNFGFAKNLNFKFGSFGFEVPFAIIGIIAMLVPFVFVLLQFQNWVGFFAVLLATVIASAVIVYVFGLFKSKLLESGLNQLALAGQLLDGFATAFAIQFFGFGEQHVATSVITGFAPFLFPAVKIILILLILWFVDKDIKNENLRGFIKVLIIIFGFATGLRDLLTLSA